MKNNIMTIDFDFLSQNWQDITALAVLTVLLIALIVWNFSLRKENKRIIDINDEERDGESKFLAYIDSKLDEAINMVTGLHAQHQSELDAQASIADANIKRYRDEIKYLKDKKRSCAMNLAINGSPADVVDRAKEYYNFLIGKV